MNHFRGDSCKKGTETGEEGACMPRFRQFGEQQFGFRVVFIGPQVFKTKDANDSEGLGYGLRPVVNVLESLSLRIGYAKRMLVAVSGRCPQCNRYLSAPEHNHVNTQLYLKLQLLPRGSPKSNVPVLCL